jgi:hypothetical protein
MEAQARKKYGEKLLERKVQRPAAARERIKYEINYDLENPKREGLIARAEAVYNRLTYPMRERVPRENHLCPETLHAEPRAPSERCIRMRSVSSRICGL